MKRAARRRGTSLDLRRVILTWITQHAQALVFSTGQYCRTPLASFLTSAVIGISLALPTVFYLALVNVQRASEGWDQSVQISLFLKMDVADEAGGDLAEELAGWPEVAEARLVTRGEALAEYQRMSGFGDALNALEENPLPAVVLVQPRLDRAGDDALVERLRGLPQVDTAEFDRQWVQRLYAILEIVRRGALILGAILAFAVMLIVGNTIRLAIYNRRDEIEVITLFGATRAFVQRPFLYSGVLHGVGGAVLAWLLVNGATLLLAGPMTRLTGLYAGTFELAGLGAGEAGLLVGAGAVLGYAGSWLALQRHLKEVEAH